MEWIYSAAQDNSCRYILGTVGIKPLICIGVNPSTATPDAPDSTIKSVQRLSANNGYDSWVMLNIYPQRATNPNEMHTTIDTALHTENLKYIESILQKYPNAEIWAAWGTLIEKRNYLCDCLRDIFDLSQEYHCQWVCFGNNSKKGHPHHPLYLSKNSDKKSFDIKPYIAALSK